MRRSHTRRRFLAAVVLGAAGGLLLRLRAGLGRTGPPAQALAPAPPETLAVAAALVGCLRRPESARYVGRAYLAVAPAEVSIGALVPLILPAASIGSAGRSVKGLRQLLRERRTEDFEAGRTVAVDGWVLSRTEARLCALATLVP